MEENILFPNKDEQFMAFFPRFRMEFSQGNPDVDEALLFELGAAIYEEHEKGVEFKALTADTRNALPASSFVFPKERRYPIHDRAHAANALARASGKSEWATVKRKVCRKYPDLPACKSSDHCEYGEKDAVWIEVFKAGTHTSANGITKTFTTSDLDTIVATYNGQKDHEAPIVLGHPKDDHPAYGWTEKLKREGDRLKALVIQMGEATKDAVRKGMFKKVSISLYPNNLLRHIGLLGAVPPAVKGLAPIELAEFAFSGEEDVYDTLEYGFATDEWRVPRIGSLFRRVREFIIGKFSIEEADKVLPNSELDMLSRSPESIWVQPEAKESDGLNPYKEENTMPIEGKEFNELKKTIEDQGKLITSLKTSLDASEAARIKDQTSFAELEKRIHLNADTSTFSSFLEGLIMQGKVLPGEKDSLMAEYGDIQMANSQLKFNEGEKSLVDKFRERLNARPVLITRKDPHFTHDKAGVKTSVKDIPSEFSEFKEFDACGMEIHEKALVYMKEHPSVTYEQAVEAVTT